MPWIERLRNLIRGRELDRGIDEELSFHLEARVRDNIAAGLSPDEARREAIRRFGNRTLTRELTREQDIAAPLESIGCDVAYGFRSLCRAPAFAVAAVLVMGLGIGANTAVFTILNGVLLRPLPFPEPERLFSISNWPHQAPPGRSMVDGQYLAFRKQDRQFESIACYSLTGITLTRAGDPVRLAGATVTPEFLRVLRINPAFGRGFDPDEGTAGHEDVVLLGDRLWRQRFAADPGIVGRNIVLDGVGHTVVGIMPPGFAFPEGVDLWLPLEVRPPKGNSFARPVIGRLKEGVSREQAQAAFEAFAQSLPRDIREHSTRFDARVEPAQDVLVSGIRRMLLVFSGAVAFVLLIACGNVANLMLIRATSRQHEMTIRAALGASRWRLTRQLLVESTIVAVAGGAVGVLLAAAGIPWLLALAPEGDIPRVNQIHLDGVVLGFTLGLSLLTGVIFGLVPAVRATRPNLRQSLSEGGRTSSAKERLRSMFVVSEVALALVLLTGAGLLLKSFWRMLSVDPGFRPQHVLTAIVDLPGSRYRTAAQMRSFDDSGLAKLAALPGVDAAAAVNWMPFRHELIRGDFELEGGHKFPPHFTVNKPVVSPDYFRAMGIRLLRGRLFSARDGMAAPGVVIVSQTAARGLWPGEDPIGKRIAEAKDNWLTVVGVVEDVRQQTLTDRPSAAVYWPYSQVDAKFFLDHMCFVVRTAADPKLVANAVRGAVLAVDPDQAVGSMATMEEVIAVTTAAPRFRARVLAAFAIMALLLCAIGIYGVLAYSIAERRREIGIRMALGANHRTIVRMVLARTMQVAGAGVLLGAAGAFAVTRVLTTFLFEVRPDDPATFAAVSVLLLAVALFAGWLPARRAASVDPLVTLRYE